MYKNKSQLLFRRLCLIVVDIISIILSFFLSAFIAYDGSMELSFLKYTYFFIPILLIGSLFFFIIMKLYDSLWSYASVRDAVKINDLFAYYHPDIVYHAAAHKHVPLMEDAPHEAIKNNVFGTYNVVKASHTYGVKKFILISTDKAVNPTNIMGASKRLCEMVVQSYNKISKTEFVAVRFGNVLGSNGSVIPLFKKQIKEGGPITITHPDIIRYFMTIPEAVSLVLQAGAYAKGGEIFVLDMGKPVKILDMARNLIKLSGLEPDVDIKIEFIGLRPGEKLYEEMLMKEEGMKTTPNKMIHIGQPIQLPDDFFDQLEDLRQSAFDEDSDIRKDVQYMVDTYHYDENTTHGVKNKG